MKDTNKFQRTLSITLAAWAIILIGTGIFLNAQDRTIRKKVYVLDTSVKKVANLKSNDIELKDMTMEVNNPLSVDVKDYIQNLDKLDPSVVKALKLDTSMVNINEPGTYAYTVTFKKKRYNAKFTITEKQLPNFVLTLKEVKLQVGDAISTNVSSYIKENLPEEVRNNLILDLSEVTTAKEGTYQYTIKNNKITYTGKVIVTPKPTGATIIKPKVDEVDEETKYEEITQ